MAANAAQPILRWLDRNVGWTGGGQRGPSTLFCTADHDVAAIQIVEPTGKCADGTKHSGAGRLSVP